VQPIPLSSQVSSSGIGVAQHLSDPIAVQRCHGGAALTTTDPIEHNVSSGDLIAELTARAPRLGANVGLWPGLTIYRFTGPTRTTYEEIRGLSLCIVAQGRKAVAESGKRYVYDQFSYLVISSRLQFQREVLEASPHAPCLCLMLQIEAGTVRKVSAEMLEQQATPAQAQPSAEPLDACFVSALDDELMTAVLRFVRSLSNVIDRRVLAPLYLQEIVYRVLQHERFAQVLQFAARHDSGEPIAAAVTYIGAHLAEPLTVSILARQVNLSASAFTRTFREATGSSPYQFVKATRLERARDILVDQHLSVADVSAAVGYTSTSHFIKEFRGRFGATPRGYFEARSRRGLRAVPSGAVTESLAP
jgi:AraC-like DNA-binding protein